MKKQDRWDQYFMAGARMAASNCKCGSRKIGAVIVVDNRIVASGYNGPPVGMPPCSERYRETKAIGDGTKILEHTTQSGKVLLKWPEDNFCPRRVLEYLSGQGLHLCPAGHAERNALNQCSRLGISTSGATLYCYCGQVCKDCAIEIVNSGIARLVFLDGQPDYDELAAEVLSYAPIVVDKIENRTYEVFARMP